MYEQFVECHSPYLNAVLLKGVECDVELSDKLLNEMTDEDDYPVKWLRFSIHYNRDKPQQTHIEV